eukprot:15141838-Alexandrium_andersonii.AAC.1
MGGLVPWSARVAVCLCVIAGVARLAMLGSRPWALARSRRLPPEPGLRAADLPRAAPSLPGAL